MHKVFALIKCVTCACSFNWVESLAPTLILICPYRTQIEFVSLSRVQAVTIGGPTKIRVANLKIPHRGWHKKCTVDGTYHKR